MESTIFVVLVLIWSLVTVLTLTNIGFTNTSFTIQWINTSLQFPTFFGRQTWSTTVHISLVLVLYTIVASRNCERAAQILCITSMCNSPWQIFNVQTPLLQSSPFLHFRPSAHFLLGRQLPPQSTSVSFPFMIPSLQVMTTIDTVDFSHRT